MSSVERFGSGSASKGTGAIENPLEQQTTAKSNKRQRMEDLEGIINVLSEQNIKLQGQQEVIKTDLAKQKEDFEKKISEEIDRVKERLDDIKIRNIEGLAIFIGFFTFISIDFQVINKARDWFAATGLISLTAGLLIGFLLFMDYLLVEKRPKNKVWVVVCFCVVSIAIGLYLLRTSYFINPANTSENNEKIVVNNNPVTSGGTVQVNGYAASTSSTVLPTSVSTTR